MNSTEHMKKKKRCHISLNCLKPMLKTIFKTAREKNTHYLQGNKDNVDGQFLIRNNASQKRVEHLKSNFKKPSTYNYLLNENIFQK